MNVLLKRLFLLTIITLVGQVSFAQFSSPYSFYGIGNENDQAFGRARAMGGLGAAIDDSLNVNLINPASLASIQHGTFHLGSEHEMMRLSTGNRLYTDGRVPFTALAFPIIKRRLSFAASLLPHSSKEYLIVDNSSAEANKIYQGYGDIYQYKMGFGYNVLKPSKKRSLKIGFTASYMRGEQYAKDSIYIKDEILAFALRGFDRLNLTGWVYDFGLMYDQVYAENEDRKLKYAIGFYGSNGGDLDASMRRERYSYVYNDIKYENPKNSFYDYNVIDSSWQFTTLQDVVLDDTTTGSFSMPRKVGVGFTLSRENKKDVSRMAEYTVGFEAKKTYWSDANLLGSSLNLRDNWMYTIGGEYLPNRKSGKKSVAYRFGMYYGDDKISVNGVDIKNMGVRVGIGVPLRSNNRSIPNLSRINLGLEIGQRGADFLYEQYIRTNISVSLNSRWFVKKKIL